jgi:cell wall-associated NlpC family hydrolase
MSAPLPTSLGTKLALAGAVVAALGLAGFVPIVGGAVASDQGTAVGESLASMIMQASEACVVAGPVSGLEPEQAIYASKIVSAAFASSGEDTQVARIALMVAWTESSLRDLGPMAGNDGSLGLFQQRGWGTPAQEMDPAAATALFVEHLEALPGWRQLPPWAAAQDIQRSKFADGSNYQANWPLSGVLLAEVMTNANQPGSCGQGVPDGIAGPASPHGLPPGYLVPAGTGPAHAAAVSFALAQLGKPYVWGAAGPDSFDCSGLTLAAWAAAGISLVHYTVDQQHEGVAVVPAALMAGDLVLTPGSDAPGPGEAGHVGIYLGDGLVESAIDPQMGVAVQTWQSFIGGGLIALRDPDPADG